MFLNSNRLYLEREKREEPDVVLVSLAIASHGQAQDDKLPMAVRRRAMTLVQARKFVSRGSDGYRLDMPNIDGFDCRLLVTPSIAGHMVLVIDRDLYRGDVSLLVTRAIQTLPEVLHKRQRMF